MKKTIILLFLINLYAVSSFCQSVAFKGIIYEHNSKANTGSLKVLSNAQVTIPYSVPVISDNKGSFKTATEGFKVGESTKIKIRKSGYEVVNVKELNDVVVGKLNNIIVYMAPEGKLYEEKLKYYNLAKKSIEKSHNEKVNNLLFEFKKKQTEYSNDNLSLTKYKEEYAKQTEKLDNEMQDALRSAKDLSKKVAEINLDFANNLLKRAVQLYKNGEIDSCLIFLNSSAFDKEGQRAIDKLTNLKESLSDEGRILDVIVEKEFFRARIYQSQLNSDSVSSICLSIHELSVKYFDAFEMDRFMDISKRIIDMSSSHPFEWINEYFYEDLLSIARLKKGRNSNAEAEANRLFGLYSLNQANDEVSFKQLEKALFIYKENMAKDTLLVIFNLIDHALTFDPNIDWTEGGKFHHLADNSFPTMVELSILFDPALRENPYRLYYLLEDPEEVIYASKILSNFFMFSGSVNEARSITKMMIEFAQDISYRSNYSDEELANLWINYLNYLNTKEGQIPALYSNKLFEINNIIDHRSNRYIDYLEKLSIILIHTYKTEIEWRDSTLVSNLQQMNNDIDKAIQYFDFLPPSEKFRLFLSKSIFHLIISDLSLNDEILENKYFGSAIEIYRTLPNGVKKYYAKTILNLFLRIQDCSFFDSNDADFFIPVRRHSIQRDLLLKACDCPNSKWREENDIYPLLDSLLFSYQYIPDYDSSILSTQYYAIDIGKFINQSSSLYDKNITQYIIESFFYGGEYGLKGGGQGLVKKIDSVSYDFEDTTDYNSLWERVSSLTYDSAYWEDLKSVRSAVHFAQKPTGYLRSNGRLSKIETYDGYNERTVKNIMPIQGSLAYYHFRKFGNESLFGLGYMHYYLMHQYTRYGYYNRNIEIFKNYVDAEFDIFEVGNIMLGGGDFIWLPMNYFLGLKSALRNNDVANYEYFQANLEEVFIYFSSDQKIQFLNNYLWFTYFYTSCGNCGNKMYQVFNDELTNSFFIELKSLLNSAIRADENNKELYLEPYLTLSVLSHLESFDYEIFEEIIKMYPNEARVYRNEALYWLQKNKVKNAIESIQKAKNLGFTDVNFFLDNKSIEKFHKKIATLFAE